MLALQPERGAAMKDGPLLEVAEAKPFVKACCLPKALPTWCDFAIPHHHKPTATAALGAATATDLLGFKTTKVMQQLTSCLIEKLQMQANRVLSQHTQTRMMHFPLMGADQGNGAAPTACGLLSAATIKVMALLGFESVFTTVISLKTISVTCSMFVDDCDLRQSAKSATETGEDIVPQMQKAADA